MPHRGKVVHVRILWYGKWSPVDGNYAYLRQISRRQADMGHTVAIAYHGRDDLNTSARDDRIEYYSLPAIHPGPTWAIESLATPRSFEHILRTFRPDVVHGSLRVGTFDTRLSTLCARHDVPLFLTFHVSFSRSISRASIASIAAYTYYRQVLSSAAAVVAFGPQQRRWLERFGGVDAEHVHEVPHGVNHVRFCPGASEWREGLTEQFVVGYVGRLAPEKNLDALCQAFLQAELDDAKLVFVGHGSASAKLERVYGKQESIDFLGVLSDRVRVADLMRGLDVFVLPSQIEGFSLSLLEAMASGVVPVATDVGEHHSLVDGCGVLIEPGRAAEGITRALSELTRHPERRKTLAVAARNRARRLGWDRTTRELMDLYRSVG